jgi:hypothetical protein
MGRNPSLVMDPWLVTVEAPLAPAHQIHLRAYAPPEVAEEDIWMYTLVTQPWPEETALAAGRLAPGAFIRRSGVLLGRWPYIRFQVRNGHAVYQLGACDLGAFEASLVDSAYTVHPMALTVRERR